MTEKQIKKSAVFSLHIIAACWLWKHFSPGSDYNSLPILAAVVFGGSLSYFFLEYLKDSPSHEKEDFMQPPRPWPKPVPQAPPKTDWELYLEDVYSEMTIDDLYEKWRGRVPRRPKTAHAKLE